MKYRLKRLLQKLRSKVLLAAMKFARRESITITLQSGQLLKVRVNDIVGREILSGDSFETHVREKILEQVKPNCVVLDIGANIGYYTVQFAKRVEPSGRVVAFEPNPEMIKELENNIELNQFKNVSIQPFALSNQRGEATFYCPAYGREAHGSLQPNVSFGVTHTIKVATRPLDDVLQELDIASVDFIKIDAEGAERSIFQGASRLLSGPNPPIVLFECAEAACQPFGHHVFDVLQDLSKYSYEIEQVDYGNWIARPKGIR